MRLGFFIQPVHPPTRAYGDVLREDREAVTLADRLGYHEAFVGEHLADAAETITSSLAFIASLADRCPSLVFGTGVLPLPSYHPVMAAAQVAMLDHLLEGRLLLGIGPGVPPDAEATGDLGSDRARKLEEAIDHVLRIWTGEPPYRIHGEFYRTTTERFLAPQIGVGRVVSTYQRPHPPIVVTSIRPDSSGPRRAGERGWQGISATYVGAHVVRAHIEGYLVGRREAGLSPEASGWRVARSIFVADDEATARKYAHAEDGAHGFYFHVMRSKLARFGGLGVMGDAPDASSADLTLGRALHDLVIAGTPEQVAERILAFRARVGPFGTLLYTGHDWVDRALARRSMELMAREVWPRVLDGRHGPE
jgi:alkanesulfonate monooxygenase SsuD/methylene tetrahydromethanopterin reductase-like flavin-dependent oxidoreductase (luciferase family)